MEGYIIRTGDGQDVKEQMRTRMREQFRGDGSMAPARVVGHEFETGYREGYREGYEQAMHDAKYNRMGIDTTKMTPVEREAYMKGMRDAYGRNGAENERRREIF